MNETNMLPSDNSPVPPLTWRDWMRPLMALLLGALFFEVFSLDRLFTESWLPGVGVTVFVFAFFGAVLVTLGKSVSKSPAGFLFMAAALALSLSVGLWSDPAFTVLNCFLILATSAMAVFVLSGRAFRDWRDIGLLPECVGLFFAALFSRIPAPFRALSRCRREKRGAVTGIMLGVALAAVLVAVMISLLSEADAVFGGLFSGLIKRFSDLNLLKAGWHILRALAAAVLLCSGLYFIGERGEAPKRAAKDKAPARNAFLLIPALSLDGVYILFCVIQFAYLFGGREAAAMEGSWAQYARTGFFQLVAVAAVNLMFCTVFSSRRRFSAPCGWALRLANAVMLLCTAVILASALMRMVLYIRAFGLSVLRLMTMWGMLVIAVSIAAAAVKLWKPDFRFWGVFMAFALASWCILSLACPDRIIADFNIGQVESGKIALEALDVDYFVSSLSPDVLPSLLRLQEQTGAYEPLDKAVCTLQGAASGPLHWTQWRLSFVPFH